MARHTYLSVFYLIQFNYNFGCKEYVLCNNIAIIILRFFMWMNKIDNEWFYVW